jgi:hypothetical protein
MSETAQGVAAILTFYGWHKVTFCRIEKRDFALYSKSIGATHYFVDVYTDGACSLSSSYGENKEYMSGEQMIDAVTKLGLY